MPNDDRLPLEHQLAARRHAAALKSGFARSLLRHAEGLRREADREMQEIEIAERVFTTLPATESEALALHASVSHDQLWAHARNTALREAQAAAEEAYHAAKAAAANNVAGKTELLVSSSLRAMVLEHAMHFLADGSWKSTEELHGLLDARGVVMNVQNPVQRVSQILSADNRFKNQRGRGWSLATAVDQRDLRDDWDQKLQHRTSELLNKDNGAR